jgi:hypothetical protein
METWKPVVGFEGHYEVSDQGNVRSLDQVVAHWRGGTRLRRGKYLKPGATGGSGAYLFVVLMNDGKTRSNRCVHRLVLEAFVGPRPEGMQACHNDGDPHNNALSNLRWDTPTANNADKKAHGTWQGGENHWNWKGGVSWAYRRS